MTDRLTKQELQTDLGVRADGVFGPVSKAALLLRFTNKSAPAATIADYEAIAHRLGVPVGHVRGVKRVEAPRGAFDNDGRPSILYERHKFRRHTEPVGYFDQRYPLLSGPPYGPGGYGAFSMQYGRLADACGLDPEAAFRACSWGAFQVMGENAVDLGYPSAYEMAKSLVASEAAHLETFARYIEHKAGLKAKFQACRPDDPDSCRPFAEGYNGTGYRAFAYHVKIAEAI